MSETLLIALGLPGLAALVAAGRAAWSHFTRYRVTTEDASYYSDDRGRCRVVVKNHRNSFRVASIDLSSEDADELLIQAKVTARDRARQLNGLSS